MKQLSISFIFSTFFLCSAIAQSIQPFQFFDGNGKKLKYKKVIKKLDESAVVLFGEMHDNPICHWLQLEVSKTLKEDHNLVFGAEMFSAPYQSVLDAYLSNEIDEKGLDTLIKLWPNYDTDYAPLLNYAKENNFPFYATNILRKYASQVYRYGLASLDTLPDNIKQFIAPLPIEYDGELSGYKAMLEMGHGHGGENMPKAQAIKDATMAHFIFNNLVANSIFIHFNGTYHSNNYEGIYWYLKRLNNALKIVTIASVEQDNIETLDEENKGKADIIICIDEDMTKSY